MATGVVYLSFWLRSLLRTKDFSKRLLDSVLNFKGVRPSKSWAGLDSANDGTKVKPASDGILADVTRNCVMELFRSDTEACDIQSAPQSYIMITVSHRHHTLYRIQAR
jgi:hypothetical protein